MGLFSKKSTGRIFAPEYNLPQPAEPAVNHQSVLDYLVELPKADYEKMLKLAVVYRNANQQADRIRGKGFTDTQTIAPTQMDTDYTITLDADDPLHTAFLEEDEDKKAPTKIKVQGK